MIRVRTIEIHECLRHIEHQFDVRLAVSHIVRQTVDHIQHVERHGATCSAAGRSDHPYIHVAAAVIVRRQFAETVDLGGQLALHRFVEIIDTESAYVTLRRGAVAQRMVRQHHMTRFLLDGPFQQSFRVRVRTVGGLCAVVDSQRYSRTHIHKIRCRNHDGVRIDAAVGKHIRIDVGECIVVRIVVLIFLQTC